jgi:ribosomal protein L35
MANWTKTNQRLNRWWMACVRSLHHQATLQVQANRRHLVSRNSRDRNRDERWTDVVNSDEFHIVDDDVKRQQKRVSASDVEREHFGKR